MRRLLYRRTLVNAQHVYVSLVNNAVKDGLNKPGLTGIEPMSTTHVNTLIMCNSSTTFFFSFNTIRLAFVSKIICDYYINELFYFARWKRSCRYVMSFHEVWEKRSGHHNYIGVAFIMETYTVTALDLEVYSNCVT